MEISPMPPISEDCSSQGESEMGDENDSNFEQLMVSMLEERDKVRLFTILFAVAAVNAGKLLSKCILFLNKCF